VDYRARGGFPRECDRVADRSAGKSFAPARIALNLTLVSLHPFMSNFFYYFCRELFLLPLRTGSCAHYDGMELVPKTGPALLLSNHISHFDPPFMTAKFPRVIHFMADKPLLKIPILG
jgi:1-acyl-sn-glycerol-3-phosphate acyltransferase